MYNLGRAASNHCASPSPSRRSSFASNLSVDELASPPTAASSPRSFFRSSPVLPASDELDDPDVEVDVVLDAERRSVLVG